MMWKSKLAIFLSLADPLTVLRQIKKGRMHVFLNDSIFYSALSLPCVMCDCFISVWLFWNLSFILGSRLITCIRLFKPHISALFVTNGKAVVSCAWKIVTVGGVHKSQMMNEPFVHKYPLNKLFMPWSLLSGNWATTPSQEVFSRTKTKCLRAVYSRDMGVHTKKYLLSNAHLRITIFDTAVKLNYSSTAWAYTLWYSWRQPKAFGMLGAM